MFQKTLLGILLLSILTVSALAVPNQLTYSGRLLQNGALVNAALIMTFKIWNDPTAGSMLWSTSNINVDVNQGIYSITLDQVSPNVFSGDNAYLEVMIGAETLAPRTRINSVGYALQAAAVTGLTNVFPSSGNVGVGTAGPNAKFQIISTSFNMTVGNMASNLPPVYIVGESNVNAGFVHMRSNNGQKNYLTFTENGVSDRGAIGFEAGSGAMNFFTGGILNNGSIKMSINPTGNIGIGTTNTGAKLHVQGNGNYNSVNQFPTTDAVIYSSEMSDSAYHSILQLASVRQSLTTGQAANGYLGFSTVDDSNGEGILDAGRVAVVNETGYLVNSPTALSFWTNTGGNKSNP
ncbi:MAG: hypothetical protein WC838_03420, partial [Candidatus Margulisiibacteriota bacterium]